jgi:hypothetical protein
MTKLSDTQSAVLTAAADRPHRIALPLPDKVRGGAAAKVVNAMLAKGLLEEVDANLSHGEPIWRTTGDGHGVTLCATDAGLAAIGALPPKPEPDLSPATPAQRVHRTGTKQAALIDMLRAPEGATLDEIVAALQWQKHTARGAMSGALKKRLGLTINATPEPGRGRVYRIIADATS